MKRADIEFGKDYAVAVGWSGEKATWDLGLVRGRVADIVEPPLRRNSWDPKPQSKIRVQLEDGRYKDVTGISVLCPWVEYEAWATAKQKEIDDADALCDGVADAMAALLDEGAVRVYDRRSHGVSVALSEAQARKLIEIANAKKAAS